MYLTIESGTLRVPVRYLFTDLLEQPNNAAALVSDNLAFSLYNTSNSVYLDHDIYCTNCGQCLTDWDELTYADPNVIAINGGDKITLTMSLLDDIATCMDDEKREEIHNEFAPCEPIVFLKEYLKIDPDFEALLNSEFSIKL